MTLPRPPRPPLPHVPAHWFTWHVIDSTLRSVSLHVSTNCSAECVSGRCRRTQQSKQAHTHHGVLACLRTEAMPSALNCGQERPVQSSLLACLSLLVILPFMNPSPAIMSLPYLRHQGLLHVRL